MKMHRILPIALMALAGLSLGSGCPTIPKLEDRIVELAMGSSTTLEFTGQSTISTAWNSTSQFNFATDVDLKGLLDDAGIDVHDVTGISVAGVSYRVSVGNGGALTIANGTVTVQRVGVNGSPIPLVTNFSQEVSLATPFITAPLSSAGVDVLNQILTDLLASLQGGSLANPVVIYSVQGTADSLPYDFKWQLKLDVSIKGKSKKITILT